jgi:hypothetical protein
MIEDAIKNGEGCPSLDMLRKRLAGKLSDKEISKSLTQLEKSNKIMFDKEEIVVWIFVDNRKLRRMLSSSIEL